MQKAVEALHEADELVADLKKLTGTRFVSGKLAYKIEYGARRIEPGNRDWLRMDPDVKVII